MLGFGRDVSVPGWVLYPRVVSRTLEPGPTELHCTVGEADGLVIILEDVVSVTSRDVGVPDATTRTALRRPDRQAETLFSMMQHYSATALALAWRLPEGR